MALEVEKHGRILIVIETIITILIGIGCLAGIIIMIALGSVFEIKVTGHPEISGPLDLLDYLHNLHDSCNHSSSFETRIRIGPPPVVVVGLSFLFQAIFLVSLLLLIILWKGLNNKESGNCNGWYITQSIFCGLDILIFLFSFAAGFPIYTYLITPVYFCYRIYSIHVVRKYANIFSGTPIVRFKL